MINGILVDLDNTLTGDAESLAEFNDLLRGNDHIGFGIATGRRLDSAMEMIEELGLAEETVYRAVSRLEQAGSIVRRGSSLRLAT